MANFGRLTFRNARASGQIISQIGSGTPDSVGWFGAGGHTSAIEIGSWNDTSIIVTNSTGLPSSTTFGGTQYMTNNKYISNTVVKISGLPKGPYQKPISAVQVFHVANLTTAPNFQNRSSGTLLIQYTASGTSKVNTFNAKLYAYDSDLTITDGPTDATILGFEINASGTAYNSSHSGVWKTMQGRDDALLFVDHSNVNRWRSAHTHIWVAALSARPNVVGVIKDIRLAFSTQFA